MTDVVSRFGKQIPQVVVDAVVNSTLESLSAMEASGFGMLGNGRFKHGAPIRTTASSILSKFSRGYGGSRVNGFVVVAADIEAALESGGFKMIREGNKVFYSL